jgi:hypothetical protein
LTPAAALCRQGFARDGQTLVAETKSDEDMATQRPPSDDPQDTLVLPAATRDFIVKALGEASQALSRSHGLQATRHIFLRDGMQLTQDNSFRINHVNHVLLMNLVRRMLGEPQSRRDDKLDA